LIDVDQAFLVYLVDLVGLEGRGKRIEGIVEKHVPLDFERSGIDRVVRRLCSNRLLGLRLLKNEYFLVDWAWVVGCRYFGDGSRR
jgi:hypothetical protein